MRQARFRAVPVAITVLFLFLSPAAKAARPVKVVDLLPSDTDRNTARRAFSILADAPVSLVPADPGLIEFIRWSAPDAGRSGCEPDGVVSEPGTSGGDSGFPGPVLQRFEALLGEAEQHLLFVELSQALESLHGALALVPCLDGILPGQSFRRFLLDEGVLNVYLDDPGARDSFRDLLAVDPLFTIDPAYHPEVRETFLAAAREHMLTPPVTLDPGGLPGDVYMDGRSLGDPPQSRPGRHVVQSRGPYGEVRTRLITLPAPKDGSPLVLAEWAHFNLREGGAVRAELIQGLLTGNLDPALALALNRYLTQTGEQSLLFALRESGVTAPVLKVYRRGVTDALPGDTLKGTGNFHVEIGLEAGVQTFLGSSPLFLASSPGGGYGIHLDLRLRRLDIGLRTAIYPYLLVSENEQADCDSSPGDSLSTGEIRCLAASLPEKSVRQLGLGVGRSFRISTRALISPWLFLEGVHLPNLLLEAPELAVTGNVAVVDSLMAGPVARLELRYRLFQGQVGLGIHLELTAGALAARIDEQIVMGEILGIHAGTQTSF